MHAHELSCTQIMPAFSGPEFYPSDTTGVHIYHLSGIVKYLSAVYPWCCVFQFACVVLIITATRPMLKVQKAEKELRKEYVDESGFQCLVLIAAYEVEWVSGIEC